jgi:hypothetical protein
MTEDTGLKTIFGDGSELNTPLLKTVSFTCFLVCLFYTITMFNIFVFFGCLFFLTITLCNFEAKSGEKK